MVHGLGKRNWHDRQGVIKIVDQSPNKTSSLRWLLSCDMHTFSRILTSVRLYVQARDVLEYERGINRERICAAALPVLGLEIEEHTDHGIIEKGGNGDSC